MRARGFTLVELIFGMAAGAVIAFVAAFLILPADNWVFILERRSGVAEVQLAEGRILREIGRVKGPSHVLTFTPTRFAFTDIADQVVDFQLSGTDFVRNGDALVRQVQSVAFEYLKEDGSAAGQASEIRVVGVALTATSGDQTILLKSAGQIKNGVQ